jgi:hypothetical protein
MMTYKPLRINFVKKGFEFSLVKREGDLAIYKKQKPEQKTFSFEVICIKRHNGYTIAGTVMEPAETYPGDSQWGIYGFTYTDLAEAEEKFNELKSNVHIGNKRRGRPRKSSI